jgi:hypothetical protein
MGHASPWNCSLKIWESMGSPTPKVGVHLGVWGFIPSHSPTLLEAWNVILGLHSWPAPSQALALVVSPRLRLWHPMKWHIENTKVSTWFWLFNDKKEGNINTTYEQGNTNMIYNRCMCNFTLVTTRKERKTKDHQNRKVHEKKQRNKTTIT